MERLTTDATPEIKVYTQGRLTFTLYPETILVSTPLQRFYLKYRAHYWKKRMSTIRIMIELGEIRSLDELAGWCGTGVEWVTTLRKYER